MYKCEVASIYDLEREDFWQEGEEVPFGQNPNQRWCVSVCFLINVINEKPKLLENRKKLYGDEIYALVCSPSFQSKPNGKLYDGKKKLIVMDHFSEEEAESKINELLAPLVSSTIAGLFEEIEKIFAVEEPPTG